MRGKGLREAATPKGMQLDLFKGLMDKHKGVEDELDSADGLRVGPGRSKSENAKRNLHGVLKGVDHHRHIKYDKEQANLPDKLNVFIMTSLQSICKNIVK